MNDHLMNADTQTTKVRFENLNYWYEQQQVLKDITLSVPANAVTVFLGPAGSGKSTLLRLINRLNDLLDNTRMEGKVLIDGEDVYARGVSVPQLRRRVGMVFALPLPIPGTIRENIVYGPKMAGVRDRGRLEELVVRTLQQAALWDEVKDRLDQPSTSLSGGQQQRLCIARSLALEPEIRAQPGAGAGDTAARRADIRAGPDFDGEGRGVAARTEEAVHRDHRAAQRAAGGAGGGSRGVLPPGRPRGVARGARPVHRAEGQANRGLYYRAFRMMIQD